MTMLKCGATRLASASKKSGVWAYTPCLWSAPDRTLTSGGHGGLDGADRTPVGRSDAASSARSVCLRGLFPGLCWRRSVLVLAVWLIRTKPGDDARHDTAASCALYARGPGLGGTDTSHGQHRLQQGEPTHKEQPQGAWFTHASAGALPPPQSQRAGSACSGAVTGPRPTRAASAGLYCHASSRCGAASRPGGSAGRSQERAPPRRQYSRGRGRATPCAAARQRATRAAGGPARSTRP